MKNKFVFVLLISFVTRPALAGDFYGIGNLGQSKYELKSIDGSPDKTDTAWMFGAGYQLNNTFSVEATYTDFGDVEKHIMYEDADERYQTDAGAFQLSLVSFLNINDAIGFYGRLGVAHVKWNTRYEMSSWGNPAESGSDSGSDVEAVYGAGMQYTLNQSLALRVEYNQVSDIDDLAISAALAGITYRF